MVFRDEVSSLSLRPLGTAHADVQLQSLSPVNRMRSWSPSFQGMMGKKVRWVFANLALETMLFVWAQLQIPVSVAAVWRYGTEIPQSFVFPLPPGCWAAAALLYLVSNPTSEMG